MGRKLALAALALSLLATQNVSANYMFRQKTEGLEPEKTGLYEFSSHRFSTCGVSGRAGPALSQCRGAYAVAWAQNSAFFDVSQGIQEWIVPGDGVYRITAAGAQGGGVYSLSGGHGAVISGDFSLSEGQRLRILVGQHGSYNKPYGGGGGGGSFVWRANAPSQPLIAAGGGGGRVDKSVLVPALMHASTTTSGHDGAHQTTMYRALAGAIGYGGRTGDGYQQCAGAGSGWLGDGADAYSDCGSGKGGLRPLAGGLGGYGACSSNSTGQHEGGFGGGGGGGCGGSGGGGGYTGGGGTWCQRQSKFDPLWA